MAERPVKPRRVAVTGVGAVDPFGVDVHHMFARLMAGDSAITHLHSSDPYCELALPALTCRHFDAEATLGRALAHAMDRFSQLGVAAAFAAWQDAGLSLQEIQERTDGGVAWGTGVGGTMTFEQGYRTLFIEQRKRVSPLSVILAMNNAAASHIAIQLGLGGPCQTYSVACASSAVAIGEALRTLREGRANLMVVGGSEAPLSCAVIRAWEAMRVVAPGDAESAYRACRPFDAGRAGLVLGEGAGALVLEEWEHAVARGATIYAELVGFGSSSDHAHLVRPEASGQIRAIREALQDGALSTEEIGYVNAHGTGTREGDVAEIAALKSVFGEQAPTLPVSATKSMHGHMLGASSALEAIITVLALKQQALPPTAHLTTIDPACSGVDHITGSGRSGVKVHAALSNSFAFGGSNAVLAFRAAP